MTTTSDDLREEVRRRYAESALAVSTGCGSGSCCAGESADFGESLYTAEQRGELPDGSVDVVISNCVINLAADKRKVLAEAARVLRPGGRFAVSDVIADEDMDEATRTDMAAWTGCIAGALTEREFEDGLRAAGFEDIDVRPTHRVHEHATSAIVRARKPSARA